MLWTHDTPNERRDTPIKAGRCGPNGHVCLCVAGLEEGGWGGGGGAQKAMVATCPFLTLELDLRPTWCHLSGKLRSCNHGGAKKKRFCCGNRWDRSSCHFALFFLAPNLFSDCITYNHVLHTELWIGLLLLASSRADRSVVTYGLARQAKGVTSLLYSIILVVRCNVRIPILAIPTSL